MIMQHLAWRQNFYSWSRSLINTNNIWLVYGMLWLGFSSALTIRVDDLDSWFTIDLVLFEYALFVWRISGRGYAVETF